MNSSPANWEVFGQGKANVVFIDTRNPQQLLRVRKFHNELSTQNIYNHYETVLRPLFANHGIVLDPYRVINLSSIKSKLWQLNNEVDLNDDHGILIENHLVNVTSYSNYKTLKLHSNQTELIMEIKPKWLYSLTTSYCRNCAMEKCFRKTNKRIFCPIGLIDDRLKEKTVDDIFSNLESCIDNKEVLYKLEEFKLSFKEYLNDDRNVFEVLKNLQNINDNKSLIEKLKSIDEVTDDLLLGMTLRDLTIFITYNKKLQINLIDLDLKSVTKWKYWKKTELQLLQSNSYDQITFWGDPCIQ